MTLTESLILSAAAIAAAAALGTALIPEPKGMTPLDFRDTVASIHLPCSPKAVVETLEIIHDLRTGKLDALPLGELIIIEMNATDFVEDCTERKD